MKTIKLFTIFAFVIMAFNTNAQNLSDIAFFNTVKVQTTRDAVGNAVKGKLVFVAPKNCKTNEVTDIYYVKYTYKDSNPLHKPSHVYGLIYHNTGDGKEYLGIEVREEIYKNESDSEPARYLDREIKLDDESAQYLIDTKTGDTELNLVTEIPVKETTNPSVKSVTVNVSKKCLDDKHPHAIDLGLPSGIKWACCNVGANKLEEYGDYYAWGETTTKKEYTKENYRYYKNGEYVKIGDDIVGTQYDVAHVKWGGKWRMPTKDEVEELLVKCKYEWTTVNWVKGGKFTGPNGNSIFLPAAGSRSSGDGDLDGNGDKGGYWSSTQDQYDSGSAEGLSFDDYLASWGKLYRCVGQSVRPVMK